MHLNTFNVHYEYLSKRTKGNFITYFIIIQ